MNRMLKSWRCLNRAWLAASVLVLAVVMTGCYSDPNPEQPFVFPGTQAAVTPVPVGVQANPAAELNPLNDSALSNPVTAELRPGELITVSFLDLPVEHPMPAQEVRIGEDGRITLRHNVNLIAAGKTATQLQEEIRQAYVPRIFKYLTVTVTGSSLYYYVGGEVRSPGRQLYSGHMTVLRAIDTAGGFGEYANKKKIAVTRATGERFVVNGEKAKEKSELDREVLPNDRVFVSRRWY